MKKKIKDLTIEQYLQLCEKNRTKISCNKNCPAYDDTVEGIKVCLIKCIILYPNFDFTKIQQEKFNQEIEVQDE